MVDTSRETPAAFARRCGLHRSTVCRAIQGGRLLVGEDGLLDVADNLARWKHTRSGLRSDVAERHEKSRAAAAGEEIGDRDDADHQPREENAVAGADATLSAYTRELLSAQNEIARIVLQLRTRRRYPLAKVVAEAQAIGSILRAALERMVDQTAPRLAVLADDPAQREAILAGECAAIKRMVRRELPRAIRRVIAAQEAK